jgi:uncharacterized protein (DUF488 family)
VLLYTIGFTRKSAERFFALLRTAGVRLPIDTRLNNRARHADAGRNAWQRALAEVA